MNLVFFLKILTDLSYYLSFACFFASLYGLRSNLLPAMLLLALSAGLSRWIDSKKDGSPLRFLPVLLWLLLLLLPTETAGWVILIPAGIYVLYMLAKRQYSPAYADAADLFRLLLKLLPLPIFLALVVMQLSRLETYSIPYIIVFLACSVLLLRMLRHDPEAMKTVRFKTMTASAVAAVLFGAAILRSPLVIKAVATFFKLLYKLIATILFYPTAGLMMGFAMVMEKLFSGIQVNGQQLEEQLQMNLMENIEDEEPFVQEPAELNPIFRYIFSGILILLAIAAVFFLFRKLASRRQQQRQSTFRESRTSIVTSVRNEPPLNRLTARTPVLQVRYWYQQFLSLTKNNGGQFDAGMCTRQQKNIADGVFRATEAQHSRLRELYLAARYGETADAEDAKEAHALYRSVRKSEQSSERPDDRL